MSVITKAFVGKDITDINKIVIKPYARTLVDGSNGNVIAYGSDAMSSGGNFSINNTTKVIEVSMTQSSTTSYRPYLWTYYDMYAQYESGKMINLQRLAHDGGRVITASVKRGHYLSLPPYTTVTRDTTANIFNFVPSQQSLTNIDSPGFPSYNAWYYATTNGIVCPSTIVSKYLDPHYQSRVGCFIHIGAELYLQSGSTSSTTCQITFNEITIDGTAYPIEILTTWEDPT